MTIETQMLNALYAGAVFTFPGLCRVAHCSRSRGLRAVRLLTDLGLIDYGRMGARTCVYFATRRRWVAA